MRAPKRLLGDMVAVADDKYLYIIAMLLTSFKRFTLGLLFSLSIFLLNRILMQGLSCCHGKGVQISYNPLPHASGKYNFSALASPQPRIVLCLQPSEVGYNYYL